MAEKDEVLFEFRQIGNSVKVTALHVPSLLEISVVGPANAGQTQLQMLALQRLKYVMSKK